MTTHYNRLARCYQDRLIHLQLSSTPQPFTHGLRLTVSLPLDYTLARHILSIQSITSVCLVTICMSMTMADGQLDAHDITSYQWQAIWYHM